MQQSPREERSFFFHLFFHCSPPPYRSSSWTELNWIRTLYRPPQSLFYSICVYHLILRSWRLHRHSLHGLLARNSFRHFMVNNLLESTQKMCHQYTHLWSGLSQHTEFVCSEVTPNSPRFFNFVPHSSAITPRPVAFVSTKSAAGINNLSPFSYFSPVSHDPPIISLGICANRDGSKKDTLVNIEVSQIPMGDFWKNN